MCRKKGTRVVVNTSSVDASISINRSGEHGEQAGMQLAYSSSKAALNMRAQSFRCCNLLVAFACHFVTGSGIRVHNCFKRSVRPYNGHGHRESVMRCGDAGCKQLHQALMVLLLLFAETSVLAHALKRDNFTIVSMCPGWVQTDMGMRAADEVRGCHVPCVCMCRPHSL